MKKMLLILALICFCISLVCSWFTGGVVYALILTVVFGLLAYFTGCLLRNHSGARWWITILVASLALGTLSYSFTALSIRHMNDITDITMEEATEENLEELKKTVTDEEEEVDEEDLTSIKNTHEENDTDSSNASADTSKPKVVTQVVEKVVEKKVPVEKIVEKIVEKEVPVEKIVTEYVEVPVVEYVEVEKEPIATPAPTPVPTPTPNQYNVPMYGGDPTGMNSMYMGGYTGDPTMMNGNYNYGYGYTGDPTGSNGSYQSVSISGSKTVTQGETSKYTISGVSSISKNKLDLPANVSVEKISGNTVYLKFKKGYTGSYSIGYGSSVINVKVKA